MKGIVFNLLEECVRKAHGEDAWDSMLDAANVDGTYTSLATYPDATLYSLVGAASKALGLPPADIVRWFGREAAGVFAERYPEFFGGHKDTRSFLGTLNDIIHPEVRKLYPGADVPSFTYEDHPDGRLSMGYHSHRKLCSFAEGLIEGSAARFGEKATIEQPTCVHRGDAHCTLVIGFSRA
jgi:hypothetical protein